MIERRRIPTRRIVARRTRCERERIGRRRVRRIARLLPGGQVAAGSTAGGRQVPSVVVVDMARGASRGNVRTSERERRYHFAVIECGSRPRIETLMALLASGWVESVLVCSVRRISRGVEIRHMARVASRRKPQEIPLRRVLVAFVALHHGVHAEQGEPVEVLRNLLHRNLPAVHRVALRAIRSKLSAMDVRVAVGAILANVGKDRFHMAAGARDLFMHAAQRILRSVVIKFGDRANRRPTRRRMAVFARNIEVAVRTLLRLALGGRCGHRQR